MKLVIKTLALLCTLAVVACSSAVSDPEPAPTPPPPGEAKVAPQMRPRPPGDNACNCPLNFSCCTYQTAPYGMYCVQGACDL